MEFMADRRETDSNSAIGWSTSLVDEGSPLGFSGNHDLPRLNNMDSSRILASEIIDSDQDHKRKCFDKLVVRTERMTEENVQGVKCSLQVEVIDDTALIEATAAVSGFKNCYGKETDVGCGNNPRNVGGSRNVKQETEGKKRRNKGSKKQDRRCSIKCVKEAKFNDQTGETQGRKISEGKTQTVFRKMCGKVKVVYQRKDSKGQKFVAAGVEKRSPPEKIIDGTFPESEMVNLKVSNENGKDSTIRLVETQTVNENDYGSDPNVNTNKNEAEGQNVRGSSAVGSKKMVYSREEIEALRFIGEEEQIKKWNKIYGGLAASVAREYTGLVVEMNNRQTQRHNRVVNCGATRHAILSMPPVLPLCSSSTYKKFAPYGRFGFRVNFH